MYEREFTLDQLVSMLRAAAGVADGVDLSGDVLDAGFENLGYDSLALLEISSLVERTYGVRLQESVVTEAVTPRLFITAVNDALAADTAA